MQEKTQSSQINGELQLKDLSEAVKFITKKFDQYETERKKKEKIINDLHGKISEMSNEIEVLKNSDSSSTQEEIASSFMGYQSKKVKIRMSKL